LSQPAQPVPQPEWIALALSGGGFRATLFHLGVVRTLHAYKLLDRVKLICSVSGGSILAGHLILNWHRYKKDDKEFEAASKEILDCVKTDLCNRVLRRWCAGWVTAVRLLGFCRPNKILQNEYDRLLYQDISFRDLQGLRDVPDIHILSTSLTTGALCKFTRSKCEIAGGRSVLIESPPLSLAVAASSAFPLFFPAVRVDDEILGSLVNQFDKPHSLTDGGVFDNLGIEDLMQTVSQWSARGLIIVSDAGALFDEKKNRYSSVLSVSRNIRANDIMMYRLGQFKTALHENKDPRLCRIAIEGELVPDDDNGAPPLEVQRAVMRIRTHLNACSKFEIDALLRHGQAKSFNALQAWGLCLDKNPVWRPVGDQIKRLKGRPVNKLDKLVQRFKWLRLGVRGIFDSATAAIILGILFWIGVFWGWPLYRYHMKLQEQERLYQQANNLTKTVYEIQALDSSGKPVANARVHVSLDDAAKSQHEGETDPQGYYKFIWQPAREEFLAHINVEKLGVGKANKEFYIQPGPVQPIQLF